MKVEAEFYERLKQINLEAAALDGKIAKCIQAEHKLLDATEPSPTEELLDAKRSRLSRRLADPSHDREAVGKELRKTHRQFEEQRGLRLQNLLAADSKG